MAGKPFFVRPLPFTVTTAGNERAGNLAAHLAEFKYPAMTWRTNGPSSNFVRFNFAEAVTIDFGALLATNATPAVAVWQLRLFSGANQTGTLLYDSGVLVCVVPTVTGLATYHTHLEFSAVSGVLSGELSINPSSGDFEASALVVGKRISTSRYYEPEWEAGPLDLSNVSDNRNGVAEEAAGVVWRQLSFTLGWLTEDEWETSIFPLMMAAGKTEPVYCCFDPEPTTYRQRRTYMGRLAESKVRKRAFNRFEKQFEIRSFY